MIRNYFKIAFRNLTRNKSYLSINVISLALSLSCGLLIFSLVKYHLSFDNFHQDSDRIFRIVTEKHRDEISYDTGVPNPLGQSFRNDYTYGEKVARILYQRDQQITIPNQKESKKFQEAQGIAFIENDFFDIFNFPLIEGNKNTILTNPNDAVITQKLANKYFGKENPIGKTIKIDNRLDLKVTGILKNLPQNTDLKTEIYVSFQTIRFFNEKVFGNINSWDGITSNMQCYTRLRPKVSIEKVESSLFKYVEIFRKGNNNVHHYKLQPLSDVHFNPNYNGVIEKNTLWVLSLIGVFLIITACLNYINLATAQAINRSKEVGVRKVLGSLRTQISAQFFIETGIITFISIVFAILLAEITLPFINQQFSLSINTDLFYDSQLWFLIPALILVLTLLSGFYPAIILSSFQPIFALKGKLTQRNLGGFNTRRSLIVIQFVISQVLIICMIVIINQMRFAKETDLGFKKESIVMIPTGSNDEKTETLKTEMQQITGVSLVSTCYAAPSAKYSNGTGVIFESNSEAENFRLLGKPGDADYLKTFDIKLVAGRNFFPSDSVNEYVVNETFAKKMNKKPAELIGKSITVYEVKAPIVGVVKDFHDKSFYEDINPVFISNLKEEFREYAVKINLANSKITLKALEKVWSKTYPEQIFSYQFLDEQIAQFYTTESTLLNLIEIFSLLAIFINCLGLYGLMRFMAVQKTKEIGIRKVLGSSVMQIVWIFGKEFSILIIISFLIASPIAWYSMNNWLQDFKYRIDISPSIFIIAILFTTLFAFITVSYQAIRAAVANPVKSLRTE
jgi:putative ABC transport system permease protein